MLVSLSGCSCYLDLSSGNNKGTLCSSVWHQRPTWTEREGGGKEPTRGREGSEGVKQARRGIKKRKRRKGEFCLSGTRKKLGSNRVRTCWEIADSLAVRDYCHVKRTVKMKETGPEELMGS